MVNVKAHATVNGKYTELWNLTWPGPEGHRETFRWAGVHKVAAKDALR